MICRIVFALTLSLLLPAVGAEVYKSVDEHGNTIYTDNPRSNQTIEKVEIPKTNSQPAIHVPPVNVKLEPPAVKHTIKITTPANGAYISSDQTQIQVSTQITPSFNSGFRVRFMHNGKSLKPKDNAPSILLDNLYRGEHQISAKLIDKSGKVVAQSSKVTFYVKRHKISR